MVWRLLALCRPGTYNRINLVHQITQHLTLLLASALEKRCPPETYRKGSSSKPGMPIVQIEAQKDSGDPGSMEAAHGMYLVISLIPGPRRARTAMENPPHTYGLAYGRGAHLHLWRTVTFKVQLGFLFILNKAEASFSVSRHGFESRFLIEKRHIGV